MSGGLWPSPEQELLLAAALGPRTEAPVAFEAWRQRVDLETEFGWGSVRLLPMVYEALRDAGSTTPLMGRLKGVYRRMWSSTHRVLHLGAPAVRDLRAAGIEVLLLKGAPLVLDVYRNHALRPILDLDVCVPMAQARAAIAILERAGWIPDPHDLVDRLRYMHALRFRHPDGGELDLHWHVLFDRFHRSADEWFWADTRPLAFDGMEVRQLAPTRSLLHQVLHGLRWNEEPPIRWIPDATLIVRRHGAEIDWDALVAFALAHRVGARLSAGLRYLVRRHAVPVPSAALARLDRAAGSLVERLEETVWSRDEKHFAGPVRQQWAVLVEYLGLSVGRGALEATFGFPDYLRYRWQLGGRREIPVAVWRALRRRVPLGGRRAPAAVRP